MSKKPKKRLVIHSNAGQDKTPPPLTQLVGWKEYLPAIVAKSTTYSLTVFMRCIGLILVVVALVSFGRAVASWQEGYGILPLKLITSGLFIAGFAGCVIWHSQSLARRLAKMEQVELLTPQNAHRLPAKETLVRASDLPPSHQQAELLRAAPQGSETPPEELLRATTNRQGD